VAATSMTAVVPIASVATLAAALAMTASVSASG
jgi:hypothetical protein